MCAVEESIQESGLQWKTDVVKSQQNMPDCSNLKHTTKASTQNHHARWGIALCKMNSALISWMSLHCYA